MIKYIAIRYLNNEIKYFSSFQEAEDYIFGDSYSLDYNENDNIWQTFWGYFYKVE